MHGVDMMLLERRFEHAGYVARRFRYPSTHKTVMQNAEFLADFIDSLDTSNIHLICHSLGGLVVRQYLDRWQSRPLGKTVMLGTPNQSSSAAKKLATLPGGKLLMGRSLEDGLLGPLPAWPEQQPLGVIAGDYRFGLGTLIPDIPQPNDGTVSVEETRLAGMHDHIVIHASHFGLLLSQQVFKQALHFIRYGSFNRLEC